jgi:hypothetical protein
MPDEIKDPTEQVREDLHDAVDAAVNDAERQSQIFERIDALDRRLTEMSQIPPAPSVDLSPILERFDAMDSRLSALETPREPETKDDESDDSDDSDSTVDDAAETAEDIADAVEETSSIEEKIAAQADVSIKPEIPERPPIKTHVLFRRLFGGR